MIPGHGTRVTVKANATRGVVVGFIERTNTKTGRRSVILLVEHAPGTVRRYAPEQLSILTPELPAGG